LRARHPEWQVYNFGVVGYGTDQEYLLLQQHFQEYHPRIVFLVFCTETDRLDNCSNGDGKLAFKPYFTVGPKGLQLHGVPVPASDCLFCWQYPLLSKPYLIRLSMMAWKNLRSPRPRPGIDPTITILEALRKYVVDHVAVFCVGLTRHEPEVERFLQSSKIPYLDLGGASHGVGDFHWDPEGHTVVAGKIEQFLLSGEYLR
jgi:hypothetical protein